MEDNCRFSEYCCSGGHMDCMAVMEAYYEYKHVFVCPGCKSLSKGNFNQFLDAHEEHLCGFGIRKAKMYNKSNLIYFDTCFYLLLVMAESKLASRGTVVVNVSNIVDDASNVASNINDDVSNYASNAALSVASNVTSNDTGMIQEPPHAVTNNSEETYVWKKKMATKRKYGQIPAQIFSTGNGLRNIFCYYF